MAIPLKAYGAAPEPSSTSAAAGGEAVTRLPLREHVGMYFPKNRRGKGRSILIVTRGLPGRYYMACMCEAKRDQKGDCQHTRLTRPLLKPWYRARMAVEQP